MYVVCGDGVREPELRAMVAAFQLPACFTGLLDPEELIAGLSTADLVVHPSSREIFPNAVGEAMSCARAVVATNSGGTAELVGEDGTAGVLVPPDDPESMAAMVAVLLKDPARRARLGAAARARIEGEFPLRRMIDGYEAALKQIIRPR